ncbi:MAG: undecaprenyl-diphosphate phosphatase [Verrucomicrobiota bacterium]
MSKQIPGTPDGRVWIISLCLLALFSVNIQAEEDKQEKNQHIPLAERSISAGESIILGIVQGVTEYLPVSSTGHLILASNALGLSSYKQTPEGGRPALLKVPALEAYQIVIQLGAILAVLGLYRRYFLAMLRGVVGRDPEGLKLLLCLVVAFLPAAVFGLLTRDTLKAHFFTPVSVAVALAAGGILMMGVEKWYERQTKSEGGKRRCSNLTDITYLQALVIGIFQCLALFPGTSRSMITIVGALLVGLTLVNAAEFSFLLALPTLGGATLYEGFTEWSGLMSGTGTTALFLGLVISFVVAAVSIKWLLHWLKSHGLTPFGIYRLALSAVVLFYFLIIV